MSEPDAGAFGILVVNPDLPVFPGGGGVEALTLRGLQPHAEVGLVSMIRTAAQRAAAQALTRDGVRTYAWSSPWADVVPARARPSTLRRLHARIVGAALERSRGAAPADTLALDLDLALMAPDLARALAHRQWHAIVVVQSSAARMIGAVPLPLAAVLVMHDIRARVYERAAAAARSARERAALWTQARRYFAFERAWCRRFDLVVTVSADDAVWVREHYQPAEVYVRRLPVDADHFHPRPGDGTPGRIVFTGLLAHPPNTDAAGFFAVDVLPKIRAQVPGAEFHIVGRQPPESVAVLADRPGVRVLADVADIRDHIAGACAVVAPLRFGSGARQKILEAWAMEKCVVATTIGAEGLAAEPGRNILIADGADGLAAAVSSVLLQPDVRDRLRGNGRAIVLRDHDPARIAADFAAAIKRRATREDVRRAPMRVLVDLQWMIPGKAGGLEQFARSLLATLFAIDQESRYTVLLAADVDAGLEAIPSGVRVVKPPAGRTRLRARAVRRLRSLARVPDLRPQPLRELEWIAGLGVQIAVSFPGYIHPLLHPLRQLLFVPDIQHEFHPEFFSADAVAERRSLFGDAVQRADRVCAISAYTKRTLVERLNVPAEKVATIALAPDPIFSPIDSPPRDAAVLSRYQLARGEYLFFPAHTWRHKNHRAAIECVQRLRDVHGVARPLVCTGGAREAQAELDALVRDAGLNDHVRFLGYVPREDLPALYRSAYALLYPSLFEGFGLPILEAMACGCPVICSNTTSLPEVAGDAALIVDPGAIDLADAVMTLSAPSVRRALIERGLARAGMFSWDRQARATLAELRAVHAAMRCF